MKRRYWLGLIPLLVLLSVVTAFAGTKWIKVDGTITAQKPQVVTTLNTYSDFNFRVHIPSFQIRDMELEGEVWDSIDFYGAARHSYPGEPAVPVFTRYIAVPQGATVQVKVNASNPQTADGLNILPAQAPAPDCYGVEEPSFEMDGTVYSSDLPFPGRFYNVEGPFTVRGLQMITLRLFPVQVQAKSGKAVMYADMKVEVSFNGSKGKFFSEKRGRSFQSLYDLTMNNMAFSQEPMPQPRGKSANGAEYVIICPPLMVDAAQTLADWKILQGYDTEVYTTDDTGTSVAAIKAWVQDAYDTWDPAPEFVLLLGDAEYISPTYDGTASDRYYFTVDGTDEWVDIYSGRISVDTAAEANKHIQDIVDYERDPIYNESFYTNSYHAAYFQHMSGGQAERRFARTTEEAYRWFDEFMPDSPFTPHRIYFTESYVNPKYWNQSTYQWTPLWWTYGDYEIPTDIQKPNLAWDGDAADIAAAVNGGTAFITHRDHGSTTGWSEPGFEVTDINALTNGDKRPVVWSINCLTGEFDDETKKDGSKAICFTEAWERHPDGGSVGLLGSTRVSYSGRNDRMFWGWLDSHWPTYEPEWPVTKDNDPEWRMGIVLEYGKLYMSYHYSSDPYRMTAIEEFHWFGEPTLEMYAGVPLEFSVSHMPIVPMGMTSFDVTVNVDGALVAMTQDGVLIGKAYSTGGVAHVEFDEAITSTEGIHLVVSRYQYRPYEADLLVGATADGIIGLDKDVYKEGDTVNVTLSDADLEGLNNYSLLIYSDTEPAGETISCTEYADTGTFLGSITVTDAAPAEANGVLSISNGDTITLYYYDEDTGSGTPEEKTDTALGDTAPPTFSGVNYISGGNTVVTLQWNAATDLTPPITYQVYRAEFSGGQNFNTPVGQTTATTYQDSGLENFVEYYYVVRATDALGHQENNTVEMSDMTVGPIVIWEEDFDDSESGIPDDWEIIDANGGITWTDDNPGSRTNSNWSGVFSIIDPDAEGGIFEQYDEQLITETISTFGYVDVQLNFSHKYSASSGLFPSHAMVDVSNDDGVTWHNVANWTDDRDGIEQLDLSDWADSMENVKLRFYYTAPSAGEYWGIDNLEMLGTPNDDPPSIDFNADVVSGMVPLEVAFTPSSMGIISAYTWNFGDGESSNDPMPTHVYEAPGTYTVTLDVTGPYGTDSETKTDYITAECDAPVLNFQADETHGRTPFEVTFTDMSEYHPSCGASEIEWDFGDGETSDEANPVHIYNTPGVYTVVLKYYTDWDKGEYTEVKTDYITVECGIPDAEFEASVTEGAAPLTVELTNTSVVSSGCDITTLQWAYGTDMVDLTTIDDVESPTLNLTEPGSYHIVLRVTNEAGSDVEVKQDFITVTEPDDDTADDDIDDDDTADDDDDNGNGGNDDDDDDDDGCGC
ncbi:MAG TPA: C25 family cysteine peptidase [bacterium]|nr:C25 family cysteine peptidase [bacterium]